MIIFSWPSRPRGSSGPISFQKSVSLRCDCDSRTWCKTIVTTSFYIRSYNSFAPNPRIVYKDMIVCTMSGVLCLQGNNDDLILSCCFYYCKDKARDFMPKDKSEFLMLATFLSKISFLYNLSKELLPSYSNYSLSVSIPLSVSVGVCVEVLSMIQHWTTHV